MKKSRTTWIVTAAVLTLLTAVTALVNIPPLTGCSSETPTSSNKHWFRATQIQVQPWRGPHHVYGIFIIQDQYKFDHLYTAQLTIQGITAEFFAGSPEDEDIYSGRAEPGHYIKRVYLPTRTALWFLLAGRFGDLRTSCHWWLVIAERVR